MVCIEHFSAVEVSSLFPYLYSLFNISNFSLYILVFFVFFIPWKKMHSVIQICSLLPLKLYLISPC